MCVKCEDVVLHLLIHRVWEFCLIGWLFLFSIYLWVINKTISCLIIRVYDQQVPGYSFPNRPFLNLFMLVCYLVYKKNIGLNYIQWPLAFYGVLYSYPVFNKVDRPKMMDHKSSFNYFHILDDCGFMTFIRGKLLMLNILEFVIKT